MIKKEFEPCPFCNSKKIFGRFETLLGYDNYYTIFCEDCGAVMTFDNPADQCIADIIKRYNHRKNPDNQP